MNTACTGAIIARSGAHSREPQTHDDPAAFTTGRQDEPHLTLGCGSIHNRLSVLSVPPARLKAEAALPALSPRLVPAGYLLPQRSSIGNDMAMIPVRLGRTTAYARSPRARPTS